MSKALKCAKEIAKYIGPHGYGVGTSIYADGKRYSISKEGKLIYDIDADPKKYVEYAGDFLTMSFEGPLYDIYNYSFCNELGEGYIVDRLEKIYNKFGYYSEMCYSWALTLCKK